MASTVLPELQPGELVVCTQPEQVPVLARYLPPGLRYLTPRGAVADPQVTDWRDGLGLACGAGRARFVLGPRTPAGSRAGAACCG